jgi:hypothetical protein
MVTAVQQWKGFTQHPQAKAIIEGLNDIPKNWALTTVSNKRPYRDNWQKETPLTKEQIKESILNGEQLWSEDKEKYYRAFPSGYGLRLGDVSGGLMALDIDGASVQQLLHAIADGELPPTVMWTSGKEGRYQLLFQVPDEYRERLKDFGCQHFSTWNGYHCKEGEHLELRYNGVQSVLPCSYHPETGRYEWLMHPKETPIAIAPDWIIKLALGELTDPAQQQVTPQLPKPPKKGSKNRWEKYLDTFEYRSEPIPLINCLSRENRELAESGVGEGSRDNTAIRIALDAVGCEQWLKANGQAYDGSAEEIVREFCSRCSPPLGEKVAKEKIKSAQKSSKGSAIANTVGDDALRNVIASYFWEKEKADYGNGKKHQTRSDNSQQQQQQIDIKAEIQQLISDGIVGTDLQVEINNLALKSGYQPRELWGIYYRSLEDSERDRDEAKTETLNLLNISKTSIKLEDIVDSKLAKPLSQIAKMMGSKDEAVLTSLLPIVASLVPTTSKLELIRSTRYYAKPVVYTGIVGESGSVKSPTQKLVLNALFQLQNDLNKEYENRLQEWEEMEVEDGQKKPPKPVPIDLWTGDATSEKVAEMLAKQEDEKQGFVIWKDELSALIKDNNAYRGGHGSDAEKLLSGRDGSPLKVDRVSKRFSVSQSSYSITGGIQPDTLKQQIDFSDPTGHWARFLFCYLPLTKQTFPEDELDIDIDDYLKSIYERLRGQSAQTYVMSAGAKELYKQWFNKLGELAYGESRQGLRNVYSKMKGDTGVIALLLHCLNAAIRGEEPEQEISETTMTSAIALTKYYIGQVKLIHAEGDAEDGELSPLYIKILNLSDRKGWIKAKDLTMSDRSFRKMNANDIRSLFTELEAMGLGKTSGKGNRLSFHKKLVDMVDTGCQAVDKSVNQLESANGGENSHNNNLVDTFDPSLDNQTKKGDQTAKTNLVDNYSEETDNHDNQNSEIPSKSETKPVDNVTTSCQPASIGDNQKGHGDNRQPKTTGDNQRFNNDNSDRASQNHQWVKLGAKPRGTEDQLTLEQQQEKAKDYLKQHGESEEMVIALATGLPSATMRQILEPIAECTRRDRWERYWKLKE